MEKAVTSKVRSTAKTAFAVILAAAMLLSSLPFTVMAEKPVLPEVIPFPDPAAVTATEKTAKTVGEDGQVTYGEIPVEAKEIDLFNRPATDWTGEEITAESSFDSYPYTPFEGSRSLFIPLHNGEAAISLTPEEPITARSVGIAVYSDGEATVTLDANGKKYRYSCGITVPGGEWQYILFDLDDETHTPTDRTKTEKKELSSLTFTFTSDGGSVIADTVMAYGDMPFMRLKYGTEEFRGEYAAFFEDRGLSVTVIDGGESTLSFEPCVRSLGEGCGLGITFERTPADGYVTLIWKDAEGRSGRTGSEAKSGQTAVLPIPETEMTSFTLIFEGRDGEEYLISRIGPMQCCTSDPDGREVSATVRKDGNGYSLTVTAEAGEEYDGRSAYLFSAAPDEKGSGIAGKVAVAQTAVKNGEAVFEIPLLFEGGGLYRRYRVAVETEYGTEIVGNDAYIENIGDISRFRSVFNISSPKGSRLEYSDPTDGITVTAVEADILSLIDGDGLNAEYADRIEKEMLRCSALGIGVYVILKAGKTGTEKDLLVYGEDGTADLSSPETGAIRTAVNWLCSHFGTPSGVCSNLVGIVPDIEVGGLTLQKKADALTLLGREVAATAKSVNRNIGVFIPISGAWDTLNTPSTRKNFSAKELIRAIGAAGTDLGIAYDMWSEGALGRDQLTLLTKANKNVILLGTEMRQTADANERIKNSAEYVYVLLRAMYGDYGGIKAVIPPVQTDYSSSLLYADTAQAEFRLDYIKEMIGSGQTERYLIKAAEDPVRSVSVIPASHPAESSISGRAVLWSFRDESVSAVGTDNCSLILSGEKADNTLSAYLSGVGMKKGGVIIPSPAGDFTSVNYLEFRLRAASLASGRTNAKATVAVFSDGGEIITEGVVTQNFSTLTVDLSRVKGEITSVGIYLSGVDGEDIGDPILIISEVSALSTSGEVNINPSDGGKIYIENLLGAGGLALVLTAAEVLRLRRKKNAAESDPAEQE